jgi:3-isopropylmalate/(R)-2-methylmalate dehydratase small subunit
LREGSNLFSGHFTLAAQAFCETIHSGVNMILKGAVHKYGANIDTDAIIAARYLNTSDAAELAKHALEDLDKDFVSKVKEGDILVAEANFGCGSSREHAPVAIKAAGVSAVVASSFARIFYRNAINIGLPVIECAEAVEALKAGMVAEIDLEKGLVVVEGKKFSAKPFPEFVLKIIEAGGLMQLTKELVN